MITRISTLCAALALTLAGGAHATTIGMGFSVPQCSLTTSPTFSGSCPLAMPSLRVCYTLEVFTGPGGTQRTRQTVRTCDDREPTGNVRVAPKG